MAIKKSLNKIEFRIGEISSFILIIIFLFLGFKYNKVWWIASSGFLPLFVFYFKKRRKVIS